MLEEGLLLLNLLLGQRRHLRHVLGRRRRRRRRLALAQQRLLLLLVRSLFPLRVTPHPVRRFLCEQLAEARLPN